MLGVPQIAEASMRERPMHAKAAAIFWREYATLAISACILTLSFICQRFAIPVGEFGVDIVGPLGLLIAAIGVGFGFFAIDRRRLILFMILTLWLAASTSLTGTFAGITKTAFSVSSLAQFLLLNSFCILSFATACDEVAFFRVVSYVLAGVAASGIIQFFAQFAGVSLFSFSVLIPDSLLFESGYNVVIPVGIGSLNKSNGFFLLEPSIFSQVMAVGLIIELLTLRRALFLAVFSTAILVAFSGTGLLVLAAYFASTIFRLGKRGTWTGVAALLLIALAAGIILFVAPDVADVFGKRMNEFNSPGSSGYARFRTPFMALASVWGQDSLTWLVGVGAGGARHINLPFRYETNTPIKIALEFGMPALILYTVMILRVERTSAQNALVLPSLVLLFVTGSYEQFAPVLFPVFLLICVAKLRPSAQFGARPTRHALAS